ncbi:amidohydrolase family protein [Altericroceibacterium spongiae]|nr:amidohydrolase family protein [Altericroceibacterium spongiae]
MRATGRLAAWLAMAGAGLIASQPVAAGTLMAIRSVGEGLGQGIYTPVVEEKIRAVADRLGDAVRQASATGVTIAFGTDAGVFAHGRNAGEFALLTDAGMSSREAVASATIIAAQVLEMGKEIGRLAPGYSADIIALEGNPLDNAALLENVDWVMVRGRVIE